MDKKNIVIVILVLLVIIFSGISVALFNVLSENSINDSENLSITTFHENNFKQLSQTFNQVIGGEKLGQNFVHGQYSLIMDLAKVSGTDVLSESHPEIYLNYISKFEKNSDSKVCEWICGVATDTCFVAPLALPTIPNGFFQQCIHLPKYTEFITSDGDCRSIEGYSIINPLDKFSFGKYFFKDITPIGKTYPQICTYYKSE